MSLLPRRATSRSAGRARADAIRKAAPVVLRETDNPAVMYGDCGLLDMIAERADPAMREMHPANRHALVLDALRRSDLVPGLSRGWAGGRGMRLLRIYYLPEKAPAHLR